MAPFHVGGSKTESQERYVNVSITKSFVKVKRYDPPPLG